MLPQTKTDKALNASDNGGSVLLALLGFAGTMGWVSNVDLTLDQAAAIAGFAGMVVTAARGWLEKGRRARIASDVKGLVEAFPLEELEAILASRKQASEVETPGETAEAPAETPDPPA